MPDARCTRGRLCSKKHRRQQPRVHRNRRHSLHNGFNGVLRALLGDHAWLPPSPARRRKRLHDLSACIGAPGPHDFAVRTNAARRATIALGDVRPSHPIPNVRDDREPPLYGERDKRKEATDLGVRSMRETATDWHDGQITLMRHALLRHTTATILTAGRSWHRSETTRWAVIRTLTGAAGLRLVFPARSGLTISTIFRLVRIYDDAVLRRHVSNILE